MDRHTDDSETSRESRALSLAALLSALLLCVLCVLTLSTGVNQQWFELARAPEAYAAALRAGAGPLRAIIAVDDLFICAYVTACVLFAARLAVGRSPLPFMIGAAVLAGGLLDLHENHHILSMLALAEQGIVPTVGEILQRASLSQLKWLLGHLAFVFVAVVLPGRGALLAALRGSLVVWQLPVGALIWVVSAPGPYTLLLWARYASLLSGFLLIAWLNRQRWFARGEGVAVDSGVPA